jgi:hypothetical protein
MGRCIFGLLLLFNIIFGLYAQCEDPEVAGPDGNCYWDEEKDGADWYTASSVCAFVSGDNSIPKVTNAFVNSFLGKLANDLGTTEPFWLGAAVDYSGKWKWFDSTNLTLVFDRNHSMNKLASVSNMLSYPQKNKKICPIALFLFFRYQ